MGRTAMKQRVGMVLLAWGAVLYLGGCDRVKQVIQGLKGGADAGEVVAEGEDAGEAPEALLPELDAGLPVALGPANAAQVVRFPGETLLNDEAAEIAANAVLAHNVPPSTGLVATLVKGAAVVKVASFNDDVLLRFANPQNPSEQLIGWVHRGAFTATPVQTSRKKCSKPQELFANGHCHVPCESSDKCAKGQTCSGVDLLASGGATPVKFCQVEVDAGGVPAGNPPPPPPPDAGAAPPSTEPTPDAGAAAPEPSCASPNVMVTFSNQATPSCHKKCLSDADCSGVAKACAAAKTAAGKITTACTNE